MFVFPQTNQFSQKILSADQHGRKDRQWCCQLRISTVLTRIIEEVVFHNQLKKMRSMTRVFWTRRKTVRYFLLLHVPEWWIYRHLEAEKNQVCFNANRKSTKQKYWIQLWWFESGFRIHRRFRCSIVPQESDGFVWRIHVLRGSLTKDRVVSELSPDDCFLAGRIGKNANARLRLCRTGSLPSKGLLCVLSAQDAYKRNRTWKLQVHLPAVLLRKNNLQKILWQTRIASVPFESIFAGIKIKKFQKQHRLKLAE